MQLVIHKCWLLVRSELYKKYTHYYKININLILESARTLNADDILRDVKLPLAGDLLGRECVTGAKKTRLGCDSPSERFQNIVETPALWHTKQSFLAVSKINVVYMKALRVFV